MLADGGPPLSASETQLLGDVADGIRVLCVRDGLQLSEEQILERARNIVAALLGNYRIESLDAQPVVASRRRRRTANRAASVG